MPAFDHAASRMEARVADIFERVLEHIDAHLFEELSVARIAAVAELSPFHFSRLFTARMGESVMSYVRARRMAHAVTQLGGDDPPSLIQLSFDCGFESQEAFTRAFTKRFGVPPGRFKREGFQTLHKEAVMTTTTAAPNLKRLDGLVRLPAFRVAGPMARIEMAKAHVIPSLWPKLFQRVPFEGQTGTQSYGVCWSVDQDEGTFNYMAAFEVTNDAKVPEGFETLSLAAQAYLVFRLTTTADDLHRQMHAAGREIWSDRLPKSGYRHVRAPDLEVYGADFMPNKDGAVVDFYVPVEA
jgi:AraC family transcriptional regulator